MFHVRLHASHPRSTVQSPRDVRVGVEYPCLCKRTEIPPRARIRIPVERLDRRSNTHVCTIKSSMIILFSLQYRQDSSCRSRAQSIVYIACIVTYERNYYRSDTSSIDVQRGKKTCAQEYGEETVLQSPPLSIQVVLLRVILEPSVPSWRRRRPRRITLWEPKVVPETTRLLQVLYKRTALSDPTRTRKEHIPEKTSHTA